MANQCCSLAGRERPKVLILVRVSQLDQSAWKQTSADGPMPDALRKHTDTNERSVYSVLL